MYIEWTEKALIKIIDRLNEDSGYLLLKYDTDDCGCAVNGVTALWFIQELDADCEKIDTNGPTIYVEKSKMIYLDEVMKIDFIESANCFMLKSPNEILNPRLSFYRK